MELSLVKVRQNLSGYLKNLSSPIVIKVHSSPKAIIIPYSEEEMAYRSMKEGNISYDDYRRKMLEIGYQDMVSRKVLVRPSDIVTSEKVEDEKTKTRLDSAEFLLEAAKFWAGHSKWHLCTSCGSMMKPVEEGDSEVRLKL